MTKQRKCGCDKNSPHISEETPGVTQLLLAVPAGTGARGNGRIFFISPPDGFRHDPLSTLQWGLLVNSLAPSPVLVNFYPSSSIVDAMAAPVLSVNTVPGFSCGC